MARAAASSSQLQLASQVPSPPSPYGEQSSTLTPMGQGQLATKQRTCGVFHLMGRGTTSPQVGSPVSDRTNVASL